MTANDQAQFPHTERNPAVQGWLDRFFESYYRLRPVNATFIGRHDFDHALPDLSPQGVDAALSAGEVLLREAAVLDERAMNPIERMDKRLAEGFLRIQQWEFTSNHFQRGNPAFYTGEAIFGVIGLFLTAYAPFAERAAAAVERMHGIDRLLQQGKRNVRQAPVEWTQRALRECAGAQAFFGGGIDLLASELSSTDPAGGSVNRAALRRAANAAQAAFQRYATYLSTELLKADSTAYACGGEAFELLMRDGHGLELTGEAIAAYAAESLATAERYLAEHAADFGAASWQAALEQLSDLHPPQEGYLARYQELWDASRRLAEQQKLLTWPDFPIEYTPQPTWARQAAPSLYFLFYRAPAAFQRPRVHQYLVTPIDATLPADEQRLRLRAANDSVIKLNHVVHHGGIGHHVQNWHAYHGPSRIGQVAAIDCASRIAMFCGGSMAEGWACYATTLMDEAGFLTPLEHFSEIHTDVRMAARAVVDVGLHHGRMTIEEAARFYVDHAGMSAAAAQGEAVKNSMFPGAAMMYLFGRDQILQLRAELRRALGAAFDLQEFHDRFLSYGSAPVALAAAALREEMTHAQ